MIIMITDNSYHSTLINYLKTPQPPPGWFYINMRAAEVYRVLSKYSEYNKYGYNKLDLLEGTRKIHQLVSWCKFTRRKIEKQMDCLQATLKELLKQCKILYKCKYYEIWKIIKLEEQNMGAKTSQHHVLAHQYENFECNEISWFHKINWTMEKIIHNYLVK